MRCLGNEERWEGWGGEEVRGREERRGGEWMGRGLRVDGRESLLACCGG